MTASKKQAASSVRIGISGWTYPPWRGVFFPKKWPQARELEYASRQVNSIEINGSFYSLQRPKSYRKWHDATPPGFVFSVKANRYVTHIRRLKDVETPIANFLASGLLCLREKLGPILWQFPPNFKYDHDKIAAFLDLLPVDTEAAAKLSRKHDRGSKEDVCTETDARRPLRHAMEIRHASFENEEFVKLLRDHGVALVVADTAGKWPFMEEKTAGFMYARLHGDEKIYVSGYTKPALAKWEKKIRSWMGGTKKERRDVFVYFDNDVKVRAPFDAMALARKFGIEPDVESWA
ncbi:MAG TPA: DUF72 domain-containing protein [Chthoniobacteraceae bacterium]|nr:DUF72 domain-containing protein [Chthoniobacteraceae bacterium]